MFMPWGCLKTASFRASILVVAGPIMKLSKLPDPADTPMFLPGVLMLEVVALALAPFPL